MTEHPQPTAQLPENLRRQFARLERRLWKVETASLLGVALAAVAASWLGLLVSDRLWDTPVWLRSALLGLALAAVTTTAIFWLKQWVLRRRDWRDLSDVVQRRYRLVGDRLLGIVELATQRDHPANYSPELCRAAIRQVAEEAGRYNFCAAVDSRNAKKLAGFAALLWVPVVLAVLMESKLAWNVSQRWLAPVAAIERHTLVDLAELPTTLIVPHGEAFEVTGDIVYRSKLWRPSAAQARVNESLKFRSPVKPLPETRQHQFAFRLPGLVEPGVMRIKVGDAFRQIAIEPAHRPSLKEMTVNIELPEYLRQSARKEKIRSNTITLLEGSRVTFRGEASRELQSASVSDGHRTLPLSIDGVYFTVGPIESSDVSQFSFTWEDRLSLTNATPWKLNVQPQRDQAPTTDLPNLSRDIAMLHSDVLDARVVARDDFGVHGIGLSWEVLAAAEESQEWSTTEVRLERSAPGEKATEELFRWSPVVYRVPEDTTIEMVSFATDFLPGRDRSESSVRRIHILGNERHAEMVRQNLESVLARVEEVARLEEKIFAKTGELREDEKLSPKDAAEKIGKTHDEQAQNARNLEELSREGLTALREALKNPVFTEDALQQWSKILNEMKNLAQNAMQASAQDLKAAQQNAGDREEKQRNLSEAERKQQEILAALEQIQGKSNKGLDDRQTRTLSERLKRLSFTEEELGGELRKILPETIGLLPKELPERFKRLESRLGLVQDDVQKESRKLQNEILRFYERTQKPNYGDVSREMAETRVAEELERLRDLIQDNVAMEASRNLAEWSKRLGDWAKLLEPPPSQSPSGSGQGESQALNMTKTLIALLRLRENELNLHRQTVLLEEQKETLKNYADRAGELLNLQQQLTGILQEIEAENQLPMLAEPYKETVGVMRQVEALLQQPQTGPETAQSELKAVELLTDVINLINEQGQRNPPPSGSESEEDSQAMAFLMQMMAPAPGQGQGMAMSQSGGGNPGGGASDQAPNAVAGDASGKGSEERRVNKASGAAGFAVPVEFRETLENYFRALEQETK